MNPDLTLTDSPIEPLIDSLIDALVNKRALIDGPDGLPVHNPATNALIARVKIYAKAEVDQIIDTAESARAAWANRTARERSVILRRLFDLLHKNIQALAELITAESGKPLAESIAEVKYGAAFIEWYAEEAKRVYGDIIPPPTANKGIIVTKEPVGVCAAITPWNFPLAMITRKIGAALAVGCPIVVKPAEDTPLTALALENLAHKAGIPVDVLRVVTTDNPAEIGNVFCDHPHIRKLSFTGSTAVGKRLAAKCGATVKRLGLELGGNAPFIVFDDADIDAAVEGLLSCKFRNSGQTCISANRILVQRGVHDEFVAMLAEQISTLKTGSGFDSEVDIGPLINAAAKEKVIRLVDSALAAGATQPAACRDSKSGSQTDNFCSPQLLTDIDSTMDIANEEVFGPVASVIKFDTEAQAISLANSTPDGLAAYFYSTNMSRVWRVKDQLEYGMIGVNESMISTEVAPFGGVKESGIGREGSKYGIDDYLELKYCLIGGLDQP